MLNVEIKVNGNLIGFMNIQNVAREPEGDVCRYSCDGYIDGELLLADDVRHRRKDGALALIVKTIKKVDR